jgi:hypothetical protein
MTKNKSTVIPVSFKNQTLDDKLLLDWLEEKFSIYGKSGYIKYILRQQMIKELNLKELS